MGRVLVILSFKGDKLLIIIMFGFKNGCRNGLSGLVYIIMCFFG